MCSFGRTPIRTRSEHVLRLVGSGSGGIWRAPSSVVMGKRLQACFEEADRLGGLVARMRLASLSQVSSSDASAPDDKPELVARTQKALDTLRGEFAPSAKGASAAGEIAAAPAGDEQARVLRRHLNTYLDLMALRSLVL